MSGEILDMVISYQAQECQNKIRLGLSGVCLEFAVEPAYMNRAEFEMNLAPLDTTANDHLNFDHHH